MRKIVGILVASLLIGVTVFMLVVGADDREVPEPDAIARGAEDEVARQKADDAAAAQAALTAAVVASVIKAFDDTDTARDHAI